MLASARPARALATVLSPASAARALATRVAAALPGRDASASGEPSSAVVTSSRCASRAVSRRGLRGERVIPCAGKKGSRGGGSASGLLSGVHPDSVEAVARIVEKAQAASDQWRVETTAFLDPALAADALMCIERAADVAAFPWGGHERAERVRLIMGRPETLGEPWEERGGGSAEGDESSESSATTEDDASRDVPPENSFRALASDTDGAVVFLDVRGNFVFDAADHRDFLGAVLGTGIERDRTATFTCRANAARRFCARRRWRRFVVGAEIGAFGSREVLRRAAVEPASAPSETRRVHQHRGVHAPGRGGLRGVPHVALEDERLDRRRGGARELARGV